MSNKYAIYKTLDNETYTLVSAWHTLEEAWKEIVPTNGEVVVQQIDDNWPTALCLYAGIADRIQKREDMHHTDKPAVSVKHDERIDHIVETLITLRKQTDTLGMAKAELLAEVKEDKLYKDRYGDFGTFCQAIGYHRTTVCNLIAAYNLPCVRDAYADIGAMAAKAIVTAHNAGVPRNVVQDLIEYAKEHKSAASVRQANDAIEKHGQNNQAATEEKPPTEEKPTTSVETKRYWLNTLKGWAEDRLSPPQLAECKAVLDELEQTIM